MVIIIVGVVVVGVVLIGAAAAVDIESIIIINKQIYQGCLHKQKRRDDEFHLFYRW